MTTIKTTERTLNLKVKSQLKSLMPNAKVLVKKHVPSVGYVFFVKDSNKVTLGKVFRDNQGMIIYVN